MESWQQHGEDGNKTNEDMRPGKGEMFAIPYGALVPKGWKNLWTAGRCASAELPVTASKVKTTRPVTTALRPETYCFMQCFLDDPAWEYDTQRKFYTDQAPS